MKTYTKEQIQHFIQTKDSIEERSVEIIELLEKIDLTRYRTSKTDIVYIDYENGFVNIHTREYCCGEWEDDTISFPLEYLEKTDQEIEILEKERIQKDKEEKIRLLKEKEELAKFEEQERKANKEKKDLEEYNRLKLKFEGK